MKIRRTALTAALAMSVGACSTPQPKAEKPATTAQVPLHVMLGQIAESRAELSEMKAMMASEPMGCALSAAPGGRSVFNPEELGCIVGWMREAQDYLAQGGAPTKYTNREQFDAKKKAALEMMAAQEEWLKNARFTAAAAPSVPVQSPASWSQDLYLQGMISFQKADYARARAAWRDALKADPSNADAQAGLDLLDKRGE